MRFLPTFVIVCLTAGTLVHAQSSANARRDARLLVTVADPSGAVIPNANVSVVGLDDATKGATIAPVQTSGQGVATISGLMPGRYSIVAEYSGFELGLLRDIRLRPGDNKHIVVLPLQRVLDTVDVSQDNQIAAADRNSTFGTTLTREQVASLSDDPAEMQQQLQDLAGGNAIIRVDSFEGAQLPPKAQIKSIHITRDAFAAENHNIEGILVDIITQPGVGTLHGMTQMRYRNGKFSGVSPFTGTKGPEEVDNYQLAFGGSLLKDRSSFSLTISGENAFSTPNLNRAQPGGIRAEVLPVKTPIDNSFMSGLLDYALTKDQTLRIGYIRTHIRTRNLGVGQFDSPERGYATNGDSNSLRIQEAGPLGRRFFTNTRLMITVDNRSQQSVLEAPTIRVLDAENTGGAQLAGSRRTASVSFASDLDYVRGKNSVRMGVQLDGLHAHSNEASNYLGTYTFESIDRFNAGMPRSYIRRIGDPNVAYWGLQAGAYVQDDVRVKKGLTLSPGLRYEAQTHLHSKKNFGPRFGITYAPWKNGKTTLRGSFGVFYAWLSPNVYEQTLRVDGVHQQEISIANPPYPDPGAVGPVLPTSRYLLADNLQMVRLPRLSVGIDETISPRVRFSSTYTHVTSSNLQRGKNLNAPVNSVFPNQAYTDIIEVVTDGSQRQNQLNNNVTISLAPSSAAVNRPIWNPKRTQFQLLYIVGKVRNNTQGAFVPPPAGNLNDDWGPAQNDIRQRMNFSVNSTAVKHVTVNFNVNTLSAAPYTMLSGVDINGDLIFNDRPAGVGRNTLRGLPQHTLNMFVTYALGIGRKPEGSSGGIVVTRRGEEGAMMNVQMTAPDDARYHINFTVQALNFTNHANYPASSYIGTVTSPLFMRPNNVNNMRKVEFLVNFQF